MIINNTIIHKPSLFYLFIAMPALWCLLLFTTVNTVFAHRVVVFAWIEGDTVFTESQFPDGRKITDGSIAIFDSENTLLTRGKTDENGLFSFKIKKSSAIKILLDAGMGHQGTWKFTEDEVKFAMGSISPEDQKAHPDKQEPDSKIVEKELLNPVKPALTPFDEKCPDIRQIEQVVEKTIDKKLLPVKRSLAQLQKKSPSVNEVLGGIGYIIGLAGIAAYFLSKKKS